MINVKPKSVVIGSDRKRGYGFSFFVFIVSIFFVVHGRVVTANQVLQNNVAGVTGIILANVLARLDEKQQNLLQQHVSAADIMEFYRSAPAEIKTALQPFGYFRAQIKSTLNHFDGKWQANYVVIPGEALRISAVDLQITGDGANDPEFKKIAANFPIKVGDVLQVSAYDQAKKILFNTAANYGYLNAELTKKAIQINLKKYTSIVVLHFATGKKYFFGDVWFAASPFSEKFLRRFLPFQVGDTYSSAKIDVLRDALSNSNFFQEVVITPELSKVKQQQVPLKVVVVPRKAKQYSFGLGYGTDTGVRGLLGLELRYLTPDGHNFQGIIRASEKQTTFETHYFIPGHNPATDLYDFSAALETQDQDYGSSTTLKFGAGYITKFYDWQQSIRLTLMQEHYQENDKPSQNATMLVPSIGWLYNKTDDLLRPTRGYSVNLSFQGTSKLLFATTDFLQSYINAKYILPLYKNDLQLVTRGTIGYTAIHNVDDLPLSLQYFTGGSQTLRGYSYNALGPGRDLLVASAELRQRVYKEWYAITFLDAGNVSESVVPELKKSIGIGTLWRSPIGLVQLTFAKALDEDGTPGKVQFSLGPEF